ncbi:MAG: hypothetical protein LBT15_04945 [Synergistaceae bacterium]|jgi:hypothetical protein|nr:hypothetical protein [Synergistaceae bacterium]
MNIDVTVELDVFGAASFDSIVRPDEVWGRMPFDVDELHRATREKILTRLSRVRAEGFSSGCVIRGDAGMGRTHLVGSLRRSVFERAEFRGVTFLHVDTENRTPGIRRTLTDRVLDSLTRRSEDGDSQLRAVLLHLLTFLGKNGDTGRRYLHVLEHSDPEWLERDISKLCGAIGGKYGVPGVVRDVMRAFFALNRPDGRASAAQAWLRGTESEKSPPPENGEAWAFRGAPPWRPREIFASVLWHLNLRGAVLLVADAAKNPNPANPETGGASPTAELANTLAAVVDDLPGVLTLLSLPLDSCHDQKISQALERFAAEKPLDPIPDADTARKLVAARMADACRRKNFTPPSPTWPFRPEAFADCRISPRDLLNRCARHRDECLRQGRLIELSSFGTSAPSAVPLPPDRPSDTRGELRDGRFEGVVEVEARREEITLGTSSFLVGQLAPATLPLRELRGHAIVLADDRADAARLLRRIVEESALFGVPSVVLDRRGGLSAALSSSTSEADVVQMNAADITEEAMKAVIKATMEGMARAITEKTREGTPLEKRRTPVFVVNPGELSGVTENRVFVEVLTNALLEILQILSPPAGPSDAPKALLAINEPHGLTPDGESAPSPASRARQHGLGLILAAPYPGEDGKTFGKIFENFDTWFLGRARSPRAVSKMEIPGQAEKANREEADREDVIEKISDLGPGEFLMRSPGVAPASVKITTPLYSEFR